MLTCLNKLSRGEIYVVNFITLANSASLGSYLVKNLVQTDKQTNPALVAKRSKA